MFSRDSFLEAVKKPWKITGSSASDTPVDTGTPAQIAEVTVPLRELKVGWLASWTSSDTLLQHLLLYSEDGSSGSWTCPQQGLKLVTVRSAADADVVVVLDDMPRGYQPLPHQLLVYVQREPSAIRRLPALDHYHATATLQTLGYHVATPWIWRPLPDLLHMDWPRKQKALVAVCSGKTFTPDQRWRLDFIKALCKADVDIDVYGRGLRPEDFHGHYRGQTTGNDKSQLLLPYRYCLALENSSEPGYFTEKVVDPLLMFTVPIYWGCPNVTDFLPRFSLFILDRRQPLDILVETVRDVTDAGLPLECQLAVTEARRKILLEYNIWPTVHKLVSSVSFSSL